VRRREPILVAAAGSTVEQLVAAVEGLQRRYWGVVHETDWRPGSPMSREKDSASISDPEQVVLEAEPYRRLAYTWHSFTPEWNATVVQDNFEPGSVVVA
jgi:Activator of Hsp90 ATPase homolog 1-like protein